MSAPLPARAAYRLWAPNYAAETVVSALDDALVSALTPPTAGRAVLDAGCGTGRRLASLGDAALALGVDASVEMLSAGGGTRVAGDVRSLPLPDARFDVVWCRLVLGHLSELDRAYGELARVCRPGGTLVATDFHPAASRAGHTRSFRTPDGLVHRVEHHLHEADDHRAAARAAGLVELDVREGAVGPSVRRFYEQTTRLDRYETDQGLPLVLALAFRRAG